MLVGAALSVEAFSARPALAPSHPTAVMRTSPVMEMVPARRAQLAGLLGATLTGITAQGASAATGPSSTPWAYSTFLDAVEAGQIEKVSLASDGKQVLSIDKDGNRHESLLLPGESANLIKLLTSKNVVFAVQAPPEPSAGYSVGTVVKIAQGKEARGATATMGTHLATIRDCMHGMDRPASRCHATTGLLLL